jgi:hypothetical protein
MKNKSTDSIFRGCWWTLNKWNHTKMTIIQICITVKILGGNIRIVKRLDVIKATLKVYTLHNYRWYLESNKQEDLIEGQDNERNGTNVKFIKKRNAAIHCLQNVVKISIICKRSANYKKMRWEQVDINKEKKFKWIEFEGLKS